MTIINVDCLGKVLEYKYTENGDDTIMYNDSFLLLVFSKNYVKFGEYTGFMT